MNGSGNVLVVRDQFTGDRDIGLYLEESGYCVINAGNDIEKIIAVFRNERVDLLLIDFAIIEGLEIAEMIRNEFDVPVIFLADNYSDDLIERAEKAGAFACLLRPFNEQQLRINIELSIYRHKREAELKPIYKILKKSNAASGKKAEFHVGERPETNTAIRDEPGPGNEKYYREMTDFLPIPIFETDEEGLITYCNSMVSELFGYSAGEMLRQMHFSDLIVIREPGRNERMFYEDFSEKKRGGITYTALRKDKLEIKVIGYFVGLYKEGQLKGMRVCLIDIDDLSKTQEQLMKFSMVIEQIGEAVIITDKNGKIEYVNPAFSRQYGYEPKEVLGKKTRVLNSGQHSYEFYRELWKTISAGNVFSAEFINKKKNGELYYEDKTIIPLRDAEKNITHFVSTGRNISEKKLAEKKIFEHQRFIDAINNTVPLIVFVYDIPGKTYTFINNKVSSILGYEPEEFIGKDIVKFVELVHPADRKKLLHIIGQKNYTDESVSQVVLKIKQKSGDYRIIEFRGVSFVRNGENSVGQILGTAQDVTEQKYHERRLNAMMRLHRLQEKKEQKIRTISLLQGQEEERRRLSRDMHDGIGQLMTAIKMKLDNIQKKTEVLAPEIADGVRDINGIMKEAITEVRRISNDLVPIGLYDFGLSSVLRQLLESVSGKNIKFFSDIGAARFPSAVEITFYRIFQETINNIQKHSCASSIDVSLVFSNNLLQLTVIDDGIGFVYNNDGPITFVGKGNGLNNMYERACTIGGRYNIQTSPGNGCRITIEVNVKKVKV